MQGIMQHLRRIPKYTDWDLWRWGTNRMEFFPPKCNKTKFPETNIWICSFTGHTTSQWIYMLWKRITSSCLNSRFMSVPYVLPHYMWFLNVWVGVCKHFPDIFYHLNFLLCSLGGILYFNITNDFILTSEIIILTSKNIFLFFDLPPQLSVLVL